MNPVQFIQKWQDAELSERSACHEHFLDLCALLEHPTPVEMDKTGDTFTFEKGAVKYGAGQGWADVWKKGHFGWEYKKRRSNLQKAYDQLLLYRESLENPPLLVVSDMNLIEIRTNFTSTVPVIHRIPLADTGMPRNLEILRAVFFEPERLRPGVTSAAVTAAGAERIASIAQRLRTRGEDPHSVARFLDRLVFCMFAEDIGLLERNLFTSLLEKRRGDAGRFSEVLAQLFAAMAHGGDFGVQDILHFNGSLFADAEVLDLDTTDLNLLHEAAKLEWSAIDPSIFGTLFERGLDPEKRTQLGAHYTSREDIETLVRPVVLKPLQREWEKVREEVEVILENAKQFKLRTRLQHRERAAGLVQEFHQMLSHLRILDPACGSGNFLYIALQMLKDLEKQVSLWAAEHKLESFLPSVHPRQLFGIEVSPYAFELAQMTVWIGYLQWLNANGYGRPREPILEPLTDNFVNRDAIMCLDDPDNPSEPEWPRADFIIGNPPFLGGKLLRREIGDEYIDRLFVLWQDRVPHEADLCAYWFEKARAQIQLRRAQRAGLLATQGIRGGANRRVIDRIRESGAVFFAESDRPWVLDGATVHVSMVGFDGGQDQSAVLDGEKVPEIYSNLSASLDTTVAKRLRANAGIAFMGDTKGGSFDIEEALAMELLHEPNPHGRPNSDVLVPWVNGKDVTQRSRGMWIIDFGLSSDEAGVAAYEAPFEYVRQRVLPVRVNNKRESYRRLWWKHVEPRPRLRTALAPFSRFIVTPTVSKHRLFAWMSRPTLPDHQLITFAVDDDDVFGLLHSRVHELWARAQGTQLRERESGFRYTPTTCYETFPWPDCEGDQRDAIAEAAADLNSKRERWLNPPEWTREEVLEFPGSVGGPWGEFIENTDEHGGGIVRFPRQVATSAEFAVRLKARTLTSLYNDCPTWLDLAHRKLDEAVFAAYGWQADPTDEEILQRLLELNLANESV